MSRVNGDKARFNRERKKRAAKRLRYRDLLAADAAPGKPAKAAASKPKPSAA
jgi:hypothetical protein